MKDFNILLAGFGGQGVLFAGKIIAYSGLIEDKHVSWLPSYGPEMRGGTANCSVCMSDEPIGSPLVTTPNVFVAMNLPSYDKFIDEVANGAVVVVDSTLVNKKSDRGDINAFYIPATKLANDNNLSGLSNMILLGKVLKETSFSSDETIKDAITKSVPKSKTHLIEPNLNAVKLGYSL